MGTSSRKEIAVQRGLAEFAVLWACASFVGAAGEASEGALFFNATGSE